MKQTKNQKHILGLHTSRTFSQKWNYVREPTSKFSTVRDFSRTIDIDGEGLCFHCGRWGYLNAEFYNLSDVFLWSQLWGLLRSGAYYKDSFKGVDQQHTFTN